MVAGVVDGRNVWRADPARVRSAYAVLLGLADTVELSSSCSLLHVPVDLESETALDPAVRARLAFAQQKVAELVGLRDELGSSDPRITPQRAVPPAAGPVRRPAVRPGGPGGGAAGDGWGCPPLATTTIGSFPQTAAIRAARADLRAGRIDEHAYAEAMRAEIARVIRLQEDLGLDVLVHGEPERNDMVQYFAEHLDGFAVTEFGWVQSYGTRCVRPPILHGEVTRPRPMTVAWAAYAPVAHAQAGQGHAHRPGHDAGLVVRPRRPAARARPPGRSRWRSATRSPTWRPPGSASSRSTNRPCGSSCRSGGPVRRPTWPGRSARSGWRPPARPTPPRSTRTCATRSSARSSARSPTWTPTSPASRPPGPTWSCCPGLRAAGYANGIGPGVYDIHSPRVPTAEELAAHLRETPSGWCPPTGCGSTPTAA